MPPLKRVKREKKQKKKVDEQPPEDSRPPAPAAIPTEAQARDSLPPTPPGRVEGSPQAWVEVRTPEGLEDHQIAAAQTSIQTSTSTTVAVGRPVMTGAQEDFLVD